MQLLSLLIGTMKIQYKMKIQDLRIGNYIMVNNVLQEVVELPLPENCTEENTKPIPITQEWFKSLNFGRTYITALHNDIILTNTGDIVINGMLGGVKPKECKYVHQLQNLYHALTGEELIINQKQIEMTKEQLFKKYRINKSHGKWDMAIDNWYSVEIYRIMHDGKLPSKGDTSVDYICKFLDKCHNDIDWFIGVENRGSMYLTAKRMIYSLHEEILHDINQ